MEQSDLLRDVLLDALEDTALLKAIKAGEASPLTTRGRVLQKLARVT